MPSAERATAALDASALLAVVRNEKGAEIVVDAIADGAAISVVNWTEVLSTLTMSGKDPAQASAELRKAKGSSRALSIEPLTTADCVEIAKLRPTTKTQGLSLADRACLVLAARLGVPALTADSIWTQAETPAEVKLIR